MRWILVFIFFYLIPLIVLFKNYKKFSRACIYACTYVVLATTIVISNMYISGIKQIENSENHSMVMNYRDIYTSNLDVNHVEEDLSTIKQYKKMWDEISQMFLIGSLSGIAVLGDVIRGYLPVNLILLFVFVNMGIMLLRMYLRKKLDYM